MSDTLQPHGLQNTRLPCPSPTARACSNSCPSPAGEAIQPFHPLLSPFLPAFNLSESLPMSQFFASGGQSIGASQQSKVLVTQSCPTLCNPMNCSLLDSPVHGILQARILELPFPSPGSLPDPGIEPVSPALQEDSLLSEPPEKSTAK